MADLLDINTSLVVHDAGDDTIAKWSDERRNDFVQTYLQRTNAARCLLHMTAAKVIRLAQRRHFISDRHVNKIFEKNGNVIENAWSWRQVQGGLGRDIDELERIAKERASAIIKELPPMKKAVQVIDPETAKMIGDVEKLQAKAQAAADKLEELPRELRMSEHKDMKVGDFLKELDKLVHARKRLAKAMQECGREAKELEITIAKRLYAGLPGITEAVVEVIETHMERATVLDQLSRRVSERIKFGDSEAAMSLLQSYEADESKVSDEMKAKLAGAMEKLRAKVKALPKAKRKKAAKKKASPRRKGGK